MAETMIKEDTKVHSRKSYPSLLILFFKTNINPTEHDPGAGQPVMHEYLLKMYCVPTLVQNVSSLLY